MKVLKKTPFGQITFCRCKNKYSLEFGNMFINFSSEELKSFKEYVFSTNYEFYLRINNKANNIRKLMLNVGHKNLFFSLHEYEFLALKELLFFDEEREESFLDVNKMKINLN